MVSSAWCMCGGRAAQVAPPPSWSNMQIGKHLPPAISDTTDPLRTNPISPPKAIRPAVTTVRGEPAQPVGSVSRSPSRLRRWRLTAEEGIVVGGGGGGHAEWASKVVLERAKCKPIRLRFLREVGLVGPARSGSGGEAARHRAAPAPSQAILEPPLNPHSRSHPPPEGPERKG